MKMSIEVILVFSVVFRKGFNILRAIEYSQITG